METLSPKKQIIISLLLTVYAFAAINAPMLASFAKEAKGFSRISVHADFPCEGHHCGCTSAADCRAHCCCFPQQLHDKTLPSPGAIYLNACGFPLAPATPAPKPLRPHVSVKPKYFLHNCQQTRRYQRYRISPSAGFSLPLDKIPRACFCITEKNHYLL